MNPPSDLQVGIFEAHERGTGVDELAEQYEVSPDRIRQIVRLVRDYRRDNGVVAIPAGTPAAGAPSIRNLAIYAGFGAYSTVTELAEQYGLEVDQVQTIIRTTQAWYDRTGTRSPVPASRVAAMRPIDGRGRPPANAPQHVIDNWLPPEAQELVLRGKAKQTIETYKMAVGWWVEWARENRVTIFPAPQPAMIRFLKDWERKPVHVGCSGRKQADGTKCEGHRPSPSAVWAWYSGMKWIQGLGVQPMPWEGGVMLTDAISGYIRQMKDDGWRPTKAPRAYKPHLRAMIEAVERAPEVTDSRYGLMPGRKDFLRALVLMAWYTGGRASDLARYRIHDVEYFPRGLRLVLAKSKARQDAKDVEYRNIFRDIENPEYDGVLAVERLINRLRENGVTQGALLRPFHKSGTLNRGAPDGLAYQMDVSGLSRNLRLVAMLAVAPEGEASEPCHQDCACGGWPRPPHLPGWQRFSIHSTRRGRLQQLLEEGADIWDVEEELGWAHGGSSRAYRAEVNRERETAANALGML